MQTTDNSPIEQAIISMIAERIACKERVSKIEADLAGYGVILADSPHGTTWSLKSLISEETSTLKTS